MAYEITFYKEDTIKKQNIYLTNSKDNSYFAVLTIQDSLNYNFELSHHDKLYSRISVLKADFYKGEFIDIACEHINGLRNRYKYKVKEYDFLLLNDTIINQEEYNLYNLKSIIKPKKIKKRKIGTNIYIIDRSTNFHLPILTHPTAYEEWKIEKQLPNGIFHEKIFINHLNEIHSREKLIEYVKIDKKIVIPKDCIENLKYYRPSYFPYFTIEKSKN